MNLRSPKIKRPEMKMPGFASDILSDLKDRHLLPLVIVLALAIVIVPIALTRSEPETPAPQPNPGLADTAGTADSARSLVIATSNPGLRDYRRRLRNLRSKDPFKQRYSGVPDSALGSEGVGASVTGSSESAAGSVTTPTAGTGSSGGGSPTGEGGGGANAGGGETDVQVETKYASYEIDVRVITGSGAKRETTVRRGLPELTMLPGRKTPAAMFMGVSADGEKALLLVSSDVRSVFGDARCVVGSSSCQLLAVEPGLPETFIYGAKARSFRIEVLKIRRTVGKSPRRASLGSGG